MKKFFALCKRNLQAFEEINAMELSGNYRFTARHGLVCEENGRVTLALQQRQAFDALLEGSGYDELRIRTFANSRSYYLARELFWNIWHENPHAVVGMVRQIYGNWYVRVPASVIWP